VTDALGVLNRWLAAPAARVVHPTEQHAALVGRLLLGAGTGGNLVGDAHLAALALEHGATVVSFDRDFARFAGVALELLAA
jgi:predicted nucleic acid-binding protein